VSTLKHSKIAQLYLPHKNVDDQSISRKPKNSHKEENHRQYVMDCGSLRGGIKPMWIDFTQEAFGNCPLKVVKSCDVPVNRGK
jgi:hypothetical protein